jgi:hypothetical protein
MTGKTLKTLKIDLNSFDENRIEPPILFIKLQECIHTTRRGGRASQEAILQNTTRECSCSTNYTHAELHSRVSLFCEQLHSRVSHFFCDMSQ